MAACHDTPSHRRAIHRRSRDEPQLSVPVSIPFIRGVRSTSPPERTGAPLMALWKEPVKSPATAAPETTEQVRLDIPDNKPETAAPVQPAQPAPRPALAAVAAKPKAESLIAPDLTIEGKIEGAGHVRIAGSFKGDGSVRGDPTTEPG